MLMKNELGFSTEHETLRLRREYLREKCAEEVEEYMHLTTCVGPNLKVDYMLRIGQLEHQVFQLRTEVARWQRRFTLRQQALNRGETPNLVEIEATLDAEFQDYLKQIKEHQAALKAAAQHAAMDRLSDKETNAIRLNYLMAVKKLHPDLNSDLPSAANELWHRIQTVYSAGDWRELEFLVGLVDDVLKGRKTVETVVNALEELKRSIARLEARLHDLERRRGELEQKEPFCWREFLGNADEVAVRQAELRKQIEQFEGVVREYETLWKRREVA